MNYIRYWQASGESLKTSIRTKTRLGQLTEEGHYTGGTVPYGYRAVDKGRVNKRNRTVLDLQIDEDEAEVIRLIFHKYVDEGYGAQRLSHYLHEQGIKSRDGKGFPNTTVNRIIKNIAYTGIIKNGESQSGYIDELRIVDVSTFSKAQEIMRQRTLPHGNVPLNCKGKSLLVGNIFCAHCGNRLTLTTSGRRVYRADGTVKYEPRMRYQCHYNVRHPGECDGQSGYGVTKLDGIVEKVIRMKFAEIAAASKDPQTFSYIDPQIRLVPKVAEDFKVELVRLIRDPLVDIKLNMAIKSVRAPDWTTCPAEKIDNIKRKIKAIMNPEEDDAAFKDMIAYWAEAYIKGIEIMNNLQEACGAIYEDLFDLEQQYKKDVSMRSRMNPDHSLNYKLFMNILEEFENTLREQFKCFSEPSIRELKRDLVSGSSSF